MNDKLPELARHIGSRIVQLRRHGGLNQQQLAARAQVSKNLLSTIENGQRVPSMTLLRRLVTALGLAAEQALIEANDQSLRELWVEVYESESPISVQLRSGHDLRLPTVQEVELVASAKPPPAPESLQEQAAVLADSQREVLRAVGELATQSLRNFTGVAHHLDRVEQRLEQMFAALQVQAEEVAALRQKSLSPPPPPPVEAPVPAASAVQVAELHGQLEQLGREFAEFRKSVRQVIVQSQHESQIVRVKIGEVMDSLRRR